MVDYSLYLVTDGTPRILGDRSLEEVVRSAIEGGVTLVQYRDKHAETAVMTRTANALRSSCDLHSIPLIINDRVDVALASNAHGVHLGQTDMGNHFLHNDGLSLSTDDSSRSACCPPDPWSSCHHRGDGFVLH